MLKKYIAPIALIIIALVIPYAGVSMTTIDKQGIVHEPLYIVTLAIILFITGIIWSLVISIKSFRKH